MAYEELIRQRYLEQTTERFADDAEIYIAILAEENGYVNLTQIEGNIIKAGQAVMPASVTASIT